MAPVRMNPETALTELFGLFGTSPPSHEWIADALVPEPYHGLLVHPHHMTVTVERFYNCSVNVHVLARRLEGDNYARQILLERVTGGVPVQMGIVRIRLDYCSPEVRAAILAEDTPLGRVLIEHNVMRRIEPIAYLRAEVDSVLLGPQSSRTTYGRLGIIHVDNKPAVELIEILAPVPPIP